MPKNDHRLRAPANRARTEPLALQYVFGGVATYLPGETLGPRVLGDYEFVWILAGEATYLADGSSYVATPGAVLLGRPGFHETYQWDRRLTTRHAFFHFLPTTLPADFPAPELWPVLRPPDESDLLRAMFRHVLDVWASHPERRGATPDRRICRVVETMLDLFIGGVAAPAPASPTTYAEAVVRTLRWLNQTLAQRPESRLTLPELARVGLVSPKHLCRLYQQALGISPMHAVRLLRLENSLALLHRSNLSVKQIAGRCGFASPYHFSRAFTEVYGAPPTVMRRQLLLGAPLPKPTVSLPPRWFEWRG